MAKAKRRRPKTTRKGNSTTTRVSVERFGVDVTDRRVIHELWPELVMHGLIQTEHSLHRLCVPHLWGQGLTEGERALLNQQRLKVKEVIDALAPIHYRLKK